MARYVMAHVRARQFVTEQCVTADVSMRHAIKALGTRASVVRGDDPDLEVGRGITVLDMKPDYAKRKADSLSADIILEPEIHHWTSNLHHSGSMGNALPLDLSDTIQDGEKELQVLVVGDGNPLRGSKVILFLQKSNDRIRCEVQTSDKTGVVSFKYGEGYIPNAIEAIPAAGFWGVKKAVNPESSQITLECPSLPQANGNRGWWHNLLLPHSDVRKVGNKIRIGVIDTGVGPHQFLSHVHDLGAIIDLKHKKDEGTDVRSHGTHVCGIIGARPVEENEFYAGVAPLADIYSLRVFHEDNHQGANQADISAAILYLAQEIKVDLINLSLGADTRSLILEDAIRVAQECGVLCICAAGNSAGEVVWPARFNEAVAVSAIGCKFCAPESTRTSQMESRAQEHQGTENTFFSTFSCFGEHVNCTGPGVGIISTVPERYGLCHPYAEMCGTSMASPAVCATLARILSDNEEYLDLPRDESRSNLARDVLENSCIDLGLRSEFQGFGLPRST